MNKKQLTIIWIALGVFVLTLLNAPWKIRSTTTGLSTTVTFPIWEAPMSGELDFGTLLVEWLGLAVVSGVLVLVLKSRNASSTPDKPN